jgi:hypothetical protein
MTCYAHLTTIVQLMLEGAMQRFAIDRYLRQRRPCGVVGSGSCFALGSLDRVGFEQNLTNHSRELFSIASSQRTGVGRLAGKPFGSVQLRSQPACSPLHPVHNAADRRFSGHFSQQHERVQIKIREERFPRWLRPSLTCSNAQYSECGSIDTG